MENPSGFNGKIECPKYIDICSAENNNMCNDLFDCLNKKSKVDQDTYMYSGDEDNDNDNNNEDIPSIRPYPNSSNYIIKNYIYLLFIFYFLGII